jgi:hypothetical protein
MKTVKYRFNRKLGQIFLDEDGELREIGNKLAIIVLWASQPIWGKPFETMPAQNWIQLTFFCEHGYLCHAVLNDGTTNALEPWIAYRQKVETASLALEEMLTTISFESADSQHQWFDYNFSGIRGKKGLGDRMRKIISKNPKRLIEPLGLIK